MTDLSLPKLDNEGMHQLNLSIGIRTIQYNTEYCSNGCFGVFSLLCSHFSSLSLYSRWMRTWDNNISGSETSTHTNNQPHKQIRTIYPSESFQSIPSYYYPFTKHTATKSRVGREHLLCTSEGSQRPTVGHQ